LELRDNAGYSRALTDRQLDWAVRMPVPEWRHPPTVRYTPLRFAALACMTVMRREEPVASAFFLAAQLQKDRGAGQLLFVRAEDRAIADRCVRVCIAQMRSFNVEIPARPLGVGSLPLPLVLAVDNGFGSKSLESLATLAKTRLGEDITHLPYKGSGPLLTDIVGGSVAGAIDALPATLPMIKTGKVRAQGVAGTQRHPLLPDVSTVVEASAPDLPASSWFDIAVPTHTMRVPGPSAAAL